jgi:RNA polymerase sigma-70 factor (ECF subfamily)
MPSATPHARGPLSDMDGDVLCLVPPDLRDRVAPQLDRYAREHGVQVVAEARRHDRRRGGERRGRSDSRAPAEERRRLRNVDGRRVADRRAPTLAVSAPAPLPPSLADHADEIRFVERLALGSEHAEDADTARLVLRWQGGDRSAFATIYERYFDRVFSYLRIALNDAHEAEDVTQQVFIQMMEALSRYELRSVPVRGWLFRIVRNHAISQARRSGRMRVEDPEIVDRRRDGAGAEESSDVAEWLSDADVLVLVERLPLAQRQVLMLRYMLDMSFHEIGQVLYRSPEAVRQLHQRAVGSLRARLHALGRTSSAEPLRVPMTTARRPGIAAHRNGFALRPSLAR